jgi:hypothetical protein
MSPEYPRFLAGFDTLHVSTDITDLLRDVNSGVECLVLFGTWCSDSWREVPRFLKTADQAGIDPSLIRFFAVDRSKKSAEGIAEQHNLERVPTFIFFRDGKEIGRIVERPATTMEEEMLAVYAREGQ